MGAVFPFIQRDFRSFVRYREWVSREVDLVSGHFFQLGKKSRR